MPYNSKNNVLMAKGEGVGGGAATCASLSQGGAVQFLCRQCSRPGYQPFAKAEALQFSIRSNTKSTDPFASSTPAGQLPGLKVFLMNVSEPYTRRCPAPRMHHAENWHINSIRSVSRTPAHAVNRRH